MPPAQQPPLLHVAPSQHSCPGPPQFAAVSGAEPLSPATSRVMGTSTAAWSGVTSGNRVARPRREHISGSEHILGFRYVHRAAVHRRWRAIDRAPPRVHLVDDVRRQRNVVATPHGQQQQQPRQPMRPPESCGKAAKSLAKKINGTRRSHRVDLVWAFPFPCPPFRGLSPCPPSTYWEHTGPRPPIH